MYPNGRYLRLLLCMLVCIALSACSTIPGSYAYKTDGQSYFHGEFEDIRIPVAMNNCSETTIITTPNNVKTGVQVFKGRVEANSLLRAMHSYLQNDGWSLRASSRSGKSLLIYEKDVRFCTIYLIDGTIFTEMQIFVVPKLQNGQISTAPAGQAPTATGVTDSAQAAPAAPAPPAATFETQIFNE